MKLTNKQLKQIIKEELENFLEGQSEMLNDPSFIDPEHPMRQASKSAGLVVPDKVKAAFKAFLGEIPGALPTIKGHDEMRKYAEAFLDSDEGLRRQGVEAEDFFKLFKGEEATEDSGPYSTVWRLGFVDGP